METARPRIPAIVVTGFLGSGKTTLMNHLLKDRAMADTAVVVNEFGDVSIDHLLVESAIENTIVLESGCICCTVRGDLVDTLRDLKGKADRGELPPFSRVLIETTGLAEPAPIALTLTGDPALAGDFRLGAIATTVDAQHAPDEIGRFAEADKQIAAADLLLLTKADLATPQAIAALTDRLRGINPGAEIVTVANGALDPEVLLAHADDPAADLSRWIAAGGTGSHDPHHHHDGDGPHAHAAPHFHGAASGIGTFVIERDVPLPRSAVRTWLRSLLSLRGADMLRLKGVVALAGDPVATAVLQCVQHVVHPPVPLAASPLGEGRTRLVVIARGVSREGVERALDDAVAAAA